MPRQESIPVTTVPRGGNLPPERDYWAELDADYPELSHTARHYALRRGYRDPLPNAPLPEEVVSAGTDPPPATETFGIGYRYQYAAAVGVGIVMAFAGPIGAAIIAVGAENMGLPSWAGVWVPILLAGLGTIQGFLPRIQRPPDSQRASMD